MGEVFALLLGLHFSYCRTAGFFTQTRNHYFINAYVHIGDLGAHESKLHNVACMLHIGFTPFISVGKKKKGNI